MKTRALIFLAVLCLLVPLSAQDSVHNTPVVPVHLTVPDIEVVNQAGEHLRFNSGVVKDRVAVITSFFTSCTAFCPMTQERLARLAKLLHDRMGKDVVFVSISVDPATDTPTAMKAWAEKRKIGPGWALVSGQTENLKSLLKSLGLFVDIQRHQSMLIIGNQKQGWVRVSSWSSPKELEQVIDGVEKGSSQSARK
ncbi:MAG TPA: SCO family protein [Candidatus Angelobacter sp.]|nr:SCO family protein [Candidatus Angelobacter sp.]